MGKNSDKKKQQELERQAAADRAQRDALITTAAAPRPLETAYDTERLDWLNATSGKNGPVDVTKLPGMGPSWGLYDAASKRQDNERLGIGALRMGAESANPGLTQLLRSQSDDQRQQAAAGQFENAYRMKDAEMRGSVLPLLGLQQNRTMGLASLASGNSANATNAYTNFRPAPSFWQTLLMSGVQGAAQGAGMAAAGSDSRLKEDIQPMSARIQKLVQLRGVSFIWNLRAAALGLEPGQSEGGVLADDVEKVFPELVTVGADGYRRVNYMALTGMLVEAVKVLAQENPQLGVAD